MTFFDKKQDVMDVKLTQFGKELLSRGFFKPVYYQFFDDDILYNSKCAGFIETQNEAENRILKDTPRLKTQHLTFPVSSRFEIEEQRIVDGEALLFSELKKTVPPSIQERILLYPMYEKVPQSESIPNFDIRVAGQEFTKISFLNTTGSGIQQNVPVIEIEPTFILREDRENIKEPQTIDQEVFVNFFEEELVFSDNSKLVIDSNKIILDIQENETIRTDESFIINVYEVDESTGEEVLIRIDDLAEINKYFHIKTNEHVEEVTDQDPRSRSYYKRGEE